MTKHSRDKNGGGVPKGAPPTGNYTNRSTKQTKFSSKQQFKRPESRADNHKDLRVHASTSCYQCEACTHTTAQQSEKMIRCGHGETCRSKDAHFHDCKPLCGFARRRREAKDQKKEDHGKKEKPKRHYRCELKSQECHDFQCHYHPGRAKVHAEDLEISYLPNLTGKDCQTAMNLFESMVDFTLVDKPGPLVHDDADDVSSESTADEYQRYLEGSNDPADYDPCADSGDEDSDSDSSFYDERLESKHNGPTTNEILAEQLKEKARKDMTDILNLIDEKSSNPPSEEKKLASESVSSVSGGDCEDSEPSQDGEQEPTLECVIIFEQLPVDSPKFGPRFKDRFLHFMREFGRSVGVLRTQPVLKHNANDGHILSNIIVRERAEMCLNRWFFQTWKKATEERMEDCIDFLDRAFTHSTQVFVYAKLAEFFLKHKLFTLTGSSLLDGDQLRKTVLLRYDKLLSEHPSLSEFSNQLFLEDTKTFVCNQLLIRGLIDRGRQPAALQPARTEVLFHRGARSNMPERSAHHFESRLRTAPLNLSSGTTALSMS